MKRFFRRPSPALVISCIALFVALGGVSYGVATGSIDSREVKNRSLTGTDMKGDKIGGGAIKESTLGTVNFSRGVENSAVVNQAGAVIRSTGGATAQRTGEGRYAVIFQRNMASCTYVATIGDESTGGTGSGLVSVATNPINPNAVNVRTANAANNAPADRSFHLIVSCF
ncbi:MAG: hypothetical protein M3356_05385 [Actinomycetota bacterium]|nr:hypothetical protein [Actinomycetota bacterium]